MVDFTPRSEHLSPAEVVGILDDLFSYFDILADRYAVEKIKTIGDCYMVAAGVPSPRPDHARALALMALDMVDAMRSRDGVGHLGLEVRIGINSGPVVAGVIGRKRFLYDLWGDAVNTASRMESQGTPGRIQITRATHDLIGDEFVCERRGTIPVKGKGEMETWYLPRATNRSGQWCCRRRDGFRRELSSAIEKVRRDSRPARAGTRRWARPPFVIVSSLPSSSQAVGQGRMRPDCEGADGNVPLPGS